MRPTPPALLGWKPVTGPTWAGDYVGAELVVARVEYCERLTRCADGCSYALPAKPGARVGSLDQLLEVIGLVGQHFQLMGDLLVRINKVDTLLLITKAY